MCSGAVLLFRFRISYWPLQFNWALITFFFFFRPPASLLSWLSSWLLFSLFPFSVVELFRECLSSGFSWFSFWIRLFNSCWKRCAKPSFVKNSCRSSCEHVGLSLASKCKHCWNVKKTSELWVLGHKNEYPHVNLNTWRNFCLLL